MRTVCTASIVDVVVPCVELESIDRVISPTRPSSPVDGRESKPQNRNPHGNHATINPVQTVL
jgi:hypothetical protein